MTRATTIAFVPRNPMARILSGPDRKSVAEHVTRAEQAVQALAPGLVAGLEEDAEALITLCRQREDEVFGRCSEIARLALGVVEMARLTGRTALAEVAEGVWEMIQALSERGAWHSDALRLHADALAGMVHGDGPNDCAITQELSRMREAIQARPAP